MVLQAFDWSQYPNTGPWQAPRWPTAAEMRRMMDINFMGIYHCVQAALPIMRQHHRGHFVLLSSVAGKLGVPRLSAYCATKWAVRGMTRSAAIELAPSGVRVNAILPGLIDTGMMRLNPPKRNASLIAAIPVGRPGQAQEVASAAFYLASDAASYITGAEIVIDGGQSA